MSVLYPPQALSPSSRWALLFQLALCLAASFLPWSQYASANIYWQLFEQPLVVSPRGAPPCSRKLFPAAFSTSGSCQSFLYTSQVSNLQKITWWLQMDLYPSWALPFLNHHQAHTCGNIRMWNAYEESRWCFKIVSTVMKGKHKCLWSMLFRSVDFYDPKPQNFFSVCTNMKGRVCIPGSHFLWEKSVV